ncbi:MAG: hypothetical protein RL095_2576 [Verrucomicrobiota bacterium]
MNRRLNRQLRHALSWSLLVLAAGCSKEETAQQDPSPAAAPPVAADRACPIAPKAAPVAIVAPKADFAAELAAILASKRDWNKDASYTDFKPEHVALPEFWQWAEKQLKSAPDYKNQALVGLIARQPKAASAETFLKKALDTSPGAWTLPSCQDYADRYGSKKDLFKVAFQVAAGLDLDALYRIIGPQEVSAADLQFYQKSVARLMRQTSTLDLENAFIKYLQTSKSPRYAELHRQLRYKRSETYTELHRNCGGDAAYFLSCLDAKDIDDGNSPLGQALYAIKSVPLTEAVVDRCSHGMPKLLNSPYASYTSLLVRAYLQQPAASAAELATRKKRILDFAQACNADFKGYAEALDLDSLRNLKEGSSPQASLDASTVKMLTEGFFAVLAKTTPKSPLDDLLRVSGNVEINLKESCPQVSIAAEFNLFLAQHYASKAELTRIIQQMTAFEKTGCACWKEHRGYFEKLAAASRDAAVKSLAKKILAEKCR